MFFFFKRGDTEGESVTMGAEIEMMKTPEAGRGKKWILLDLQTERGLASTLMLASTTMNE